MSKFKNDKYLSQKIVTNDWTLPFEFIYDNQIVKYGVMGEGYPLILLHGTPFSSIVWRRICPYLALKHKVYYFDLLGYGKSEKKDEQDVSLGIQNEMFTSLLKYLQVKNPDIVAHDFGGTTALRAHLLNEIDYRSLTLIDPVVFTPSGSPFVQATIKNEAVFANLPAYIHQAALEAYINNSVVRKLSDDVIPFYTEPWLGEKGQSAFYRQIAQMSDKYIKEIEACYSNIRCPVTILWGAEDNWIPKSHGEKLHKIIPGSSLRIIDSSGHLVQEDAPEAIVAAVLDFTTDLTV